MAGRQSWFHDSEGGALTSYLDGQLEFFAGIKRNGAGAPAARTNGGSPPVAKKAGATHTEPIIGPIEKTAPQTGRVSRIFAAVILGAAGLGLAAIGATATVSYSLESTGTLMAALAAAADATSLIMPASACCLWKTKRRLLAVIAWCLWLGATSVTAANVAGYIASHTDVFLAGREVASTERGLVLERVARLRAERGAISERRPIGAITVAIQNAHVAELEALRTALAMAKRRDAIDAELAGLEPRLAGLPAVTMADPSTAVLADILRMPADEIDLRRIRIAVLLTLPLTAGLLVAMAMAIGTAKERTP
jgi:hypothetical protein